jgi:hypothetical protein
MTKSVVVLAVPHQVQGPGFQSYISNSSYSSSVSDLIKRGQIDFIFEEAGGRAPSIAKDLAESLLGPGHYLDVDPSPNEREKYGIVKRAAPKPLSINCESAIVKEQDEREQEWKRRIETNSFKKGLLICGLCHNLSIAFRLLSAGIMVERTYSYIPRDAFRAED